MYNIFLFKKDILMKAKSPSFTAIKKKSETHISLMNNKKLKLISSSSIRNSSFDNSNINKDLIIIAKLAGLSKKISFHTARHTNATLLIYNGVNITTVQKLLGHKSVKTTQVYTNIMDMTIVHDLEKIKQAALGIKKKTDNSFNK